MTRESKKCQNCHQEFWIESDDFKFYEKINVPPPTFCPECREQRRIAFRNERALYKRKCDLCGKEVVSRVSPDKPYPMCCQECWWSDKWDPLSYGRDYDFSRPFFEQFKELLFATPHIALLGGNSVNSEWVNQETDDKNCYLNVGGHYNEDSAYNTYEIYGKDSFDNFWLMKSELCYGSLNCERCYQTHFSQECFDCQDVAFSYDCRGSQNLFGCAGLRHKQYYIFNKPYSKEDYQRFLKDNPLSSHRNFLRLRQKSEEVWLSLPHRDSYTVKSVNSTGYSIIESKNAKNCWNGEQLENCKNLYISGWVKDSYDGTSIGGSELTYECSSGGGSYNSKFLAFAMSKDPIANVHAVYELEYCYCPMLGHNCFGCANIKNQEYCILNKQYTKEEYEELMPKIIKHMNDVPYVDKKGRIYKYGEFFPLELAPYGYNETAAMDYYPLTREEALAKGFPWSDYEAETNYKFSDYVIPDDINDVKDDILDKVLKCEKSGKPYRIIPMELQFYRRMGLPIPRRSPLERHKERMTHLLPRKLFDRVCECQGSGAAKNGYKNTGVHQHGSGKCGAKISTPYAPNRPELIYCEQCYNAEVV